MNSSAASSREIDRIARIVRQMFELYRPEHREAQFFQPATAIQDVAAMLQGNCTAHGVTLAMDTQGAARAVSLHADSLKQILFNILQNAIEASPAGSEVRIQAMIRDETLHLTVTDDGCGIPAEARAHIFDPFFSTKDALTTGGMGLGLSVTHGLVESLGGSITFESNVGHGTCFHVLLPVQL